MNRLLKGFVGCIFTLMLTVKVTADLAAAELSDTLVQWQPMTVDFNGPFAQENGNNPNPFLDYRLQVVFTSPSGSVFNVPGYFAGDGEGGASGSIWRVKFTPDESGQWDFEAQFRQGANVAVSLSNSPGSSAWFDGESGSFSVSPFDSGAPGFLSKGRLEMVGEHYFRFQNGDYWIKGGMDSPENFLAYSGFDNTPQAHYDYAQHRQEWNSGDPDWDSPDSSGSQNGRGIIGALNYMASQNLNSIYFMPMTIGGDSQDISPYSSPNIVWRGSSSNDNVHFDISKLHQWDAVFEHAQRKGIYLHFVLNDSSRANKLELDYATLGTERKLFYRELVARFGYLNALQWNVSEEYNLDLPYHPNSIKDFAGYIFDIDPFDHPITVHNHGNTYMEAQTPFIGDTRFGVMSIQTWQRPDDISDVTEYFREQTALSGWPIPVSVDESMGFDQISAAIYRKRIIWDSYLSGGGNELFSIDQDIDLPDFHEYEELYQYLWYARKFMEENLPFWLMEPADHLVTGEDGAYGGAEVFALSGEIYAIYFPETSAGAELDVQVSDVAYELRWYNPRTGEFEGQPVVQLAGQTLPLGIPPSESGEDWALLVQISDEQQNVSAFKQASNARALLTMNAINYHSRAAKSNHDWVAVEVDGGSEGTAMLSSPNSGDMINNGYPSSSPRMDFRAEFSRAGTHYIWVRGLGDSDGDSVNDSLHVGLNGQANSSSDRITGFNSDWSWTQDTMDSTPAVIEIPSAGVHTINVWMREDGLIVDKIVFTPDSSFDPVSDYGPLGPPQSPEGNIGEEVLAAPTVSPAAGDYFGEVTVTLEAESGATIYYTLDGTDPSSGSASAIVYTSPFTLSGDTVVKAISSAENFQDSGVAEVYYSISDELTPPLVLPSGGSYLDSVEITIESFIPDTSVYYTLDGSNPTSDSSLYIGPISLTESATIKAVTVLNGFEDSAVVEEVYEISTISVGEGVFRQSASGVVSMEAENATGNVAQGNHTWEAVVPGSHSGPAAMQAAPNTDTLINSNYTSTSPRLDFEVEFVQAGTHYVWLRGLGDTDGEGLNDSVHVGLNGQAVSSSDRITGFNSYWSWTQETMDNSPAVITVPSAGVHTINIWMREDGLIVDKIVLAADAGFDPVAEFGEMGPPQSPIGDIGEEVLAAPLITPASGDYFGEVEVSMTAEPEVTIYYTLDGSEPNSESSSIYAGPFVLTQNTVVKAISVAEGFEDSAVAEASYSVDTELTPPVFSPVGGSYLDSVQISLSTSTPQASIYYTTDGSTPTSDSSLYQGSITLVESATVKAVTVLGGFEDSAVVEEVYEISTINVGEGVFRQSLSGVVSMEAENATDNVAQGNHSWDAVVPGNHSGAAAMQAGPNTDTLINTNYTSTSPRLDFDVEFVQAGTHYVWIRGLADSDGEGVNDSVHVGLNGQAVSSADRITGFNSDWSWTQETMDNSPAVITVPSAGVHTINIWMREDGLIVDKIVLTTDSGFDPVADYGEMGPPQSPIGDTGEEVLASPVITPASGDYFGEVEVSMTAEPDVTIYYTLDGSEPNSESSSIYAGPFVLTQNTVVKAISVAEGFEDSAVAQASYSVSSQLTPPVFSPAGGSYVDSVQVSLSTSTSQASIYYTTNGSTPSISSTLYQEPFALTESATVKAVTLLEGYEGSVVAEESYEILEPVSGGTFIQAQDGLVSLEAENATEILAGSAHIWEATNYAGHSGVSAMQATPNSNTLFDSNYVGNAPSLNFDVNFNQTGVYYVWVRGAGDSDGESINDSVHVGIDGQINSVSDRITGFNSDWSWTQSTMDYIVALIEVNTTGVHTINVWMREDGVIVDKIVLTLDSEYSPEAEGPPQSPVEF